MSDTLAEKVEKAAQFIGSQVQALSNKVGIILGTGLSGLAEKVEIADALPYGEIPYFVHSTVLSHGNRLIFGRMDGVDVVLLEGRFHYYEGYSLEEITFPVRVLKALGVETLIVTNASGGLHPDWKSGDIVALTDHIGLAGLTGGNPLIGPNDESLGPRFPDMFEPYSNELLTLARDIARRQGITLREGVYVWVTGPNLETRAEYRMLRLLGADLVGMSTVPEVIVAVHAGMKVAAFSIVTDVCTPAELKPANIDEIIAIASAAEPKLTALVHQLVQRL